MRFVRRNWIRFFSRPIVNCIGADMQPYRNLLGGLAQFGTLPRNCRLNGLFPTLQAHRPPTFDEDLAGKRPIISGAEHLFQKPVDPDSSRIGVLTCERICVNQCATVAGDLAQSLAKVPRGNGVIRVVAATRCTDIRLESTCKT